MRGMSVTNVAILLIASAAAIAIARNHTPVDVDRGHFSRTSTYELGFSPEGTAETVVLHAIASAHESILVAAYSFTSRTIANALVDAKKRGVQVSVLADAHQNTEPYSMVRYLANRGIEILLVDQGAAFHHKFFVVDGQHVELGSFNFSSAAKGNAENAVYLMYVPEIARRYSEEWETFRRQGIPVQMGKEHASAW